MEYRAVVKKALEYRGVVLPVPNEYAESDSTYSSNVSITPSSLLIYSILGVMPSQFGNTRSKTGKQ